MSAIRVLFQQAQLAEAAYANFWDGELNAVITNSEDVLKTLIANGFSKDQSNPTRSTQAATFVSQWRVVDHIPDTNTGFSNQRGQHQLTF